MNQKYLGLAVALAVAAIIATEGASQMAYAQNFGGRGGSGGFPAVGSFAFGGVTGAAAGGGGGGGTLGGGGGGGAATSAAPAAQEVTVALRVLQP
jgi:hypothetical protein